jgi:UDP-N-acetylmuramoyl-L-alanyl-D-glutamate--2,6-diaminopimelate ligase
MFTVGVTGTNGKTSMRAVDGAGAGPRQLASRGRHRHPRRRHVVRGAWNPNSTPPATPRRTRCCWRPAWRSLRDAGASALAIEVSSIGLAEERTAGMHFDVAVFTNLTRDHLDYHGDMASYEAAKRKLFEWPGLKHAVLNLDDPAGGASPRTCARSFPEVA